MQKRLKENFAKGTLSKELHWKYSNGTLLAEPYQRNSTKGKLLACSRPWHSARFSGGRFPFFDIVYIGVYIGTSRSFRSLSLSLWHVLMRFSLHKETQECQDEIEKRKRVHQNHLNAILIETGPHKTALNPAHTRQVDTVCSVLSLLNNNKKFYGFRSERLTISSI